MSQQNKSQKLRQKLRPKLRQKRRPKLRKQRCPQTAPLQNANFAQNFALQKPFAKDSPHRKYGFLGFCLRAGTKLLTKSLSRLLVNLKALSLQIQRLSWVRRPSSGVEVFPGERVGFNKFAPSFESKPKENH